MSDAIAFDTHKFVKHLTEKGFTEEQAEALANLATKTDLEALKAELLKWMFGALIAQCGLILALAKL